MSEQSGKTGAVAEAPAMPARLVVASSPHIRTDESIPKIMWTVFCCLLPACAVGVSVFGIRAAVLLAVSTATAVATEAIWQKLTGRPVTIHDGSAAVTGLLLGMVCGAGTSVYVVMVGAVFAILIAKQLFGGLGMNIWNPALAARAFLQVSFPVEMNAGWPVPKWTIGGSPIFDPKYYMTAGQATAAGKTLPWGVDCVTGATVLHEAKEGLKGLTGLSPDLWAGSAPGCIGETSAIALIAGGLFLIYKRYIRWEVPAAFFLTIAALALVLPMKTHGSGGAPVYTWDYGPLFHLAAGGVMIGGFFMLTDMVTSPLTVKGQVIYAIGAGVLVMLIRNFGGYPEGVCYAILIMNTLVPMIDRFVKPKVYGTDPKAARGEA
ncbi:MAG: RnfABCDGE type electron transport complex subunit D [Planctomycetota bacterium]|nr:RnfABCDGE type electron transport complex subunit D [Planctomycetota bacterium]